MWTLVGPGDTAIVPSPSYPIHLYGPIFAGAELSPIRIEDLGPEPPDRAGEAVVAAVEAAWEAAHPRPRVLILSFPHNPTTACIDLPAMTRLVEFAREKELVLVHDFAYSDTYFDGYRPPSVLEVPGAKDVAVELYTMTKSFSMAGWRVAYLVGNGEVVQSLTKLKTYLDYGSFQPIQLAAAAAIAEAPEYPKFVNEIYQSRRDTLCDGLRSIGWDVPRPLGTMFVWARIPEAYREMGSLEFARFLVLEGGVATSAGVGFGEGGDGHVRFALVENEDRIRQAIDGLKRCLTRL
jgi:alanine-synthesizing transaminase